MTRFIACSILCRCSWQYIAALLLRRHSTSKPNSEPSRTFTIDMGNLKFLLHHKHYYKKKEKENTYIDAILKKKQRICREKLQIRALRKPWGVILCSPKARQLLPPCCQALQHMHRFFQFFPIYPQNWEVCALVLPSMSTIRWWTTRQTSENWSFRGWHRHQLSMLLTKRKGGCGW